MFKTTVTSADQTQGDGAWTNGAESETFSAFEPSFKSYIFTVC